MSMTIKMVLKKGVLGLLVTALFMSGSLATYANEETNVNKVTPAKIQALADHLSNEVPQRTSHVADKFTTKYSISKTIADYVISWQMDYEGLGGWSKRFDDRIYSRKWNGTEKISYQYTQSGTVPMSTLDNDATTSHIQYLAAVYSEYGGAAYKSSVLKAMDTIFHMQHEDGAWGEMYPVQTGSSQFENHSTINDQVHFNNMSMFQKILNNEYPFNSDLFNSTYKQKIKASYDKALDFVLKAQLKKVDGTPTLWAGKYETNSYKPRWARHFEPPEIMTTESIMILYHLISIPDKSHDIKESIYYGAMWLNEYARMNTEYRVKESPYFFSKSGAKMWYRFHDIESGNGIFAESSKILNDIMSLSEERRHGFGWATDTGSLIYDETAKFLISYGEPEPVIEPKPEPELEPEPVVEPEPQPQPEPQPPSSGSGVSGGSDRSTQLPQQQPEAQPPSGGSGGSGSTSRSGSQDRSTQRVAETAQTPAIEDKGVSFTINAPTYSVDGERQLMDAAPYIKDGRMMIPVRHLEVLFGIKPYWNGIDRSVSINFGGMTYKVVIGSKVLTANNAPLMELDVSAEILGNRTFVPASRFARAMGIEYKFDERTRTATFI